MASMLYVAHDDGETRYYVDGRRVSQDYYRHIRMTSRLSCFHTIRRYNAWRHYCEAEKL